MVSKHFAAAAAVFICAVCVSVSPEAFAQTRIEREFTVSRAGLNLDDPWDAALMYARIESAATDVCRYGFGRRPQNERHYERRCIERAIDSAVAELGAPQVTAVAAQQRPAALAMAR